MTMKTSIPVARPLLPETAALLQYLSRIDATRWYSNWGPLQHELCRRLETNYGTSSGRVTAVASGTAALTAALLALCPPGKYCLMPSWTFFASPLAAIAAGLTPYFLDVDPETGMLSPEQVRRALAKLDRHQVGSVMPVSAFGAEPQVSTWGEFQEATGIPVVIDAAAAFDTVTASSVVQCISLHATKVLGCGEGGFVLSTNQDVVRQISQISNFGFSERREIGRVGMNAKLSEYHAAVGLAALDQWPDRRRDLLHIARTIRDSLQALDGVSLQPGWGVEWISATCVVQIETNDIEPVSSRMAADGIGTRQWWKQGCHLEPAFRDFPREPLPCTEAVAAKTLGLPFFPDMTGDQIARVTKSLGHALRELC